MSQERMLAGFAMYKPEHDPVMLATAQHNLIGVPIGTRLMRIYRTVSYWRLWIATKDYIHGTYMELHNDGRVYTITARAEEGDEIVVVRPTDAQVKDML